jgi:hypothetical protein
VPAQPPKMACLSSSYTARERNFYSSPLPRAINASRPQRILLRKIDALRAQ